ncbi:N-acetylmuramoyl-L-alanine amidase [Cytobacillus sp. FSL W8-0315]|uniref:N-acetylmuramoyl-L-alanine amidase n=1 Tax=Cytobacillus sp. FSL W8-0315 TaxID=2921600 RepID=UPI0030FB81D0
MKISLSPGHASTTSGKQTPDGMKEWEFNAAVVKCIIDGLENYEDVQVLRLDDPSGKKDISLKTRSDKANAWKSDVHIDIHANAAGPGGWYDDAKGIETFVYTSKPKEALTLAQKVQSNLVSATKLQNRGVKAADFHMLRETKMTSILIEAGFMTNKDEAKLLKSDNYRRIVAGAILDALVSHYGLKQKARVSAVKKEDLSKVWGADSIKKVIDQGVIPGYSDGTWRPNEPIKRAELAVILDRLGLLNKK